MTLEEIEEQVRLANERLRQVEQERSKAEREAITAVRERFKDQWDGAQAAKSAVLTLKREHVDANATHPWEGKKVYRIEKRRVRTWSRETETVKIVGVVEVRRSGTEMPANKTWGLPELGQAFVRLCNANGKVGKRIDDKRPDAVTGKYSETPGQPIWKLVEGEE